MATATPHARSSLRRTACDRCRHSKLKCFRDENQQKCARCLRLELRCEVAPAKPPGRPRKVVSPPIPAGESADPVLDVPSSPQLRGPGHSPLDSHNDETLVQSPEELLPGSDDQQIGTIFGQKPMPSHSNINGWTMTSAVAPPSEFRMPEWYEMSCFDAGLPPIRDPLEVHSLFTARLDRHECIKELSNLNVDLHVQSQAIRELIDTDRIKFSIFTDHPPPPAGDGVSLAEKLLIMSQRFQQAVTNLGWVVKNEPAPPNAAAAPVPIDDDLAVDPLLNSSNPSPASAGQASSSECVAEQDGPLETPFVFLLVSCYVQMINLWEIMYYHVHRRIIGIDRDQLTLADPGKGIQMGAFYIFSGRLQSMFFCQAVLYFIENIDRGLGIMPEQRQQGVSGLLSHRQNFDLLQRELGGQVHEGVNERVRALRDSVERARICCLQDVGW